MKKLLTKGIISTFLIAGLLATGGLVQAQEGDDSATAEELRERIQELQDELLELRLRLREEVGSDSNDVPERIKIRIEQRLNQGDQGLHVRRLQQLLSTDDDIYPEGLVTGYYGPLTTSAVARLQARMGLRADGEVDDETLRRINQLLEEGAGNSGVIPPGLLRAPGIQRMLHANDSSTSTDDEDNEDDNDEFWFDDLPLSDVVKARLRSVFKNKNDDFRFRHRVRVDDDDRGELEIEVEIEEDRARIKIEHRDGTETRYRFEFTDRDDIIAEIESRTGLTEEEIREVIEFENDDDEKDDSDDDEDDNEDDDDEEDDDEEDDDDDGE